MFLLEKGLCAPYLSPEARAGPWPVKSNLCHQERIIYLNASLKSIRHSGALVGDDGFYSDAVNSRGLSNLTRGPSPRAAAERKSLGAPPPAVIDRASADLDVLLLRLEHVLRPPLLSLIGWFCSRR